LIAFWRQTDRQTDRQTNKQMDSPNELSRSRSITFTVKKIVIKSGQDCAAALLMGKIVK